MSKEKATHQDSTEFEGPIETGDAQKKRPADKKKNGQQEPDTSVSNKDKGTVFTSGKVAEQVEALFADVEGLSEGFTEKATVIFEGALSERIEEIREEIEGEFNERLNEAYETMAEDLEDKLDGYLQVVVENYIKENQVALESGFKTEVAEQVMKSVTDIIESAGVELSPDKVDVADALAEQVDELESKLNESMEETVNLRKQVRKYQIQEAFEANTTDLSEGSKEKLRKLSENIHFDDVDGFVSKLSILKESISTTNTTSNTDIADLTEATDGINETKKTVSPQMESYLAAARGYIKV